MRFVRHRDQQAFAQIVERHGRLVWTICRQVLRHQQDVEDAFQATFLILAQRAQSIRASESASAWLYKVAMRTALLARRKRGKRREEPLVHEPPADDEARSAIGNREMLYVLLQEVRMLPARYQTPLVMRYLEGQSRRAIAEQTDSTVGQIQGRLARGRRLLRSRFLRRGVSLSLAAGAMAGTAQAAQAAVTPALVAGTAKTCFMIKTSGAAVGLSPAALELAKEGIKAMWIAFTTKCAAVVSTVVLVGSIGLAAQKGGGASDGDASAGAKTIQLQAAAAESKSKEEAVKTAQAIEDKQTQRLIHQLEEVEADLAKRRRERTHDASRLELAQLQKSFIQQRLERLNKTLSDLETSVGSDEEAEVTRIKRRDDVRRQMENTKRELIEYVDGMAELSNDVESRQQEVSRLQRRLDELDRLKLQLELRRLAQVGLVERAVQVIAVDPVAAPGQATYQNTPVKSYAEFERERLGLAPSGVISMREFPAAESPPTKDDLRMLIHQMEAMRQSLLQLGEENAALRRQAELSRPGASTTYQDARKKVLQIGDEIIVTFKSNQPSIQDSVTTFKIDSHGLIVLDPSHDSVPVEIGGKDKREAAELIRKAMKQPNSWAEIVVNQIEPQSR